MFSLGLATSQLSLASTVSLDLCPQARLLRMKLLVLRGIFAAHRASRRGRKRRRWRRRSSGSGSSSSSTSAAGRAAQALREVSTPDPFDRTGSQVRLGSLYVVGWWDLHPRFLSLSLPLSRPCWKWE